MTFPSEDCPGFTGPRWPVSSIKTTKPLGHKCPFAHTYLELKFKAEEDVKKQILKKMYDNVERSVAEEHSKPNWNPAGAKFTDCHGCGHEIKKPGAKGSC